MTAPAPSPPPTPPGKPRRRYLRWAFDIALILAVLFAFNAWRTRDVPPGPLPDFHAHLSTGAAISLNAWRERHSDRPALIYFWADWCPVCTAVEPGINRIARDWPVLGVAMQSGTIDEVAALRAERNVPWETMVDTQGRLSSQLGVRGVPTFIIVDASGATRFVRTGYVTSLGLRARLWWAASVSASSD